MQFIKRKTKAIEEPKAVNLKAYGYNSNGVFTISMNGDKDGEELLLNINSSDLKKLLIFVKKLNIETNSRFEELRN